MQLSPSPFSNASSRRSAASAFLPILVALLTLGSVAQADPGAEPRNVAVSADGAFVLSTSVDSDFVMVTPTAGGAPVALDVGAPSWGIAMLDAQLAVVTHPDEEYVSVLVRNPVSGQWEVNANRINAIPRFCYEATASPLPGRFFVANRGAKPAEAVEEWVQAVYEIEINKSIFGGTIVRTFVTERGPRGLAVSPDGARLYVGTLQGSLGGTALAPDTTLPSWPHDPNDGGSVLAYPLGGKETLIYPDERFEVGSPVRGMALYENSLTGRYRLYFSHVGFGSQSEDPDFGGRDIPNVLGNIEFGPGHVALSRQDAVFGHDPDFNPRDPSPSTLPAVLHEDLVVRSAAGSLELWVTNSGSGTASRAALNQDGSFVLSAGPAESVDFTVLTRSGLGFVETPVTVAYPVLAPNAGTTHADLSDQSVVSLRFTSNPRGIAYDAIGDRVWAVTQFGSQLMGLDGATMAVVETETFSPPDLTTLGVERRNFFGVGRGFFFRETEDGAAPVATLTCGTCHPDAHLDGKVRFTVRQADNFFDSNTRADKPVAVPSIFDVGFTEWIFFEGLRTVRDFDRATVADPEICNYCDGADFFKNTRVFTNASLTPRSPGVASTGRLSRQQLRGRFLFESMNCNRCHNGPIEEFRRTDEEDLPSHIDEDGPLPLSLATSNRFLHDPSQSFITFIPAQSGGGGLLPKRVDDIDRVSLRNMTDVGTREAGDAFRLGINTPALAGAWQNAPYMHDGRYRTLYEVLSNTWLATQAGYTAAPWYEDFADNAHDDDSFEPGSLAELPNPVPPLFPFGTHEDRVSAAPGFVSVVDHLPPDALEDLMAFLTAVSSQTNLCGKNADQAMLYSPFMMAQGPDCYSLQISWATSVPMACRVEFARTGDTPTLFYTAPGQLHTLDLDVSPGISYTIRTEIHTVCGQKIGAETTFQAPPCFKTQPADSRIATRLGEVLPNPAPGRTSVQFSLAQASEVSLKVFDVRGRLVKTLVEGSQPRGHHSQIWGGENEQGQRVAAGTYFLVFQADGRTERGKVLMLR